MTPLVTPPRAAHTDTTPPPGGSRGWALSDEAAGRGVVQALRIMVGAVFMTTVFDNLHHHAYTVAGYRRLIDGYLAHGTQPAFQRSIMRFAAHHAALAGPVQEATEIALGVCLLAGLAVPVAALVASGLLGGLMLSEWGVSWPWELPPLLLMAVLVVFASMPVLCDRGVRAWLWERPSAGGLLDPIGVGGRLALALLAGVVCWYLLRSTRQGQDTSLRAAVAVSALLAANIILDRAGAIRQALRREGS